MLFKLVLLNKFNFSYVINSILQEFFKEKMGNITNNQEQQNTQTQFQFIQIIDDTHFGTIEIHRITTPPYQYVMNYKRIFMETDTKIQKYINIMNTLRTKQHKNIAKIYSSQLKEETHMCIKDKRVNTFVAYYNFTLKQALDKRKQLSIHFSQSQLVYIMSCLVDVSLHLKKFNNAVGDFTKSQIYLSPEGFVKIYLLELQENFKHSGYYKALSENSLIDSLILSPQQLFLISNLQYDIKYDIFQSQVFCIGMLIFELLMQDQAKFYYSNCKKYVNVQQIQYNLKHLNKVYGLKFLAIMNLCLKQNPDQRITLQELSKKLTELRNDMEHPCHCIRLFQGQSQQKRNTLLIQSRVKKPIMLNNLDKKLQPSPISTLSSSTNSSFRSGFMNTSEKKSQYRFLQ